MTKKEEELQAKLNLAEVIKQERDCSDSKYAEMRFQKAAIAVAKWILILIGAGLGTAWLKLIIK
jgi:hypothetical protein